MHVSRPEKVWFSRLWGQEVAIKLPPGVSDTGDPGVHFVKHLPNIFLTFYIPSPKMYSELAK